MMEPKNIERIEPLPFSQSTMSPLTVLRDCHRRIDGLLDVLVTNERLAYGGPLTGGQQWQVEVALNCLDRVTPRHAADEEKSLFPRLRASHDAGVGRAVGLLSGLERDLELAGAHFHTVDRLWRRWMKLGNLPGSRARELRDHLAVLRAIYRDHIVLEDHVLFPVAGRLLSPIELRDIGREMAARRH